MYLKILSATWRPFCVSLNVLSNAHDANVILVLAVILILFISDPPNFIKCFLSNNNYQSHQQQIEFPIYWFNEKNLGLNSTLFL